ncbi:hypothetical protein GOP47_0012197 [Adiantum capillus-veneris]|uniref:Transmembrane protein n=1 Tax=Adiantum capillus-veneris TaxID=13818 RepID=A0A9D4UQY9_ADICA|nr:hypothetical protein GOP47_0012197 [Adiantum capillus-veneris]
MHLLVHVANLFDESDAEAFCEVRMWTSGLRIQCQQRTSRMVYQRLLSAFTQSRRVMVVYHLPNIAALVLLEFFVWFILSASAYLELPANGMINSTSVGLASPGPGKKARPAPPTSSVPMPLTPWPTSSAPARTPSDVSSAPGFTPAAPISPTPFTAASPITPTPFGAVPTPELGFLSPSDVPPASLSPPDASFSPSDAVTPSSVAPPTLDAKSPQPRVLRRLRSVLTTTFFYISILLMMAVLCCILMGGLNPLVAWIDTRFERARRRVSEWSRRCNQTDDTPEAQAAAMLERQLRRQFAEAAGATLNAFVESLYSDQDPETPHSGGTETEASSTKIETPRSDGTESEATSTKFVT